MNISIIGGGSWGLGLAKVLADNRHDVLVYDVNQTIVNTINQDHQCLQLATPIPDSIQATASMAEAIAFSDTLLFVVPTQVLRQAITAALEHIQSPKRFINAAKGIEPETFMRISEIFIEMVPAPYFTGFAALSGPSHAEEVIRGMTTVVTCAATDLGLAKDVQALFHNAEYFRVYTSTDLVGVELGGSIKNAFALAAGILKGMGAGDNALAAMMSRALVEMARYFQYFNAQTETLMGLSGVGDLIVTCTSEHSRNFQAGYKIGSGTDLKATLDSMTMVVEGIRTAQACYQLAQQENIESPIIEALHTVVFEQTSPRQAMRDLLHRTIKSEAI